MAKYRGPVCRLCRREGEKLFLKGSRCMTEKCAIERRSYPPGQHGQARPRISDYSTQLRENRNCDGYTDFKKGSSGVCLNGRNDNRV